LNNLGSYNGAVEQQVAQQLAQQIGVQPQQVLLSQATFPVSAQVVVAGAPRNSSRSCWWNPGWQQLSYIPAELP
jgi:hypothetical protein